jgi:hypothetical protein
MRRLSERVSINGFKVVNFHRLYIFAGILYLLYADFLMFDPKEFGNGALRSGGVLSASSSWMPSYTVENSILRDFIIDPNGTTDYSSKDTYLDPNVLSSWCAGFNKTGEWIQVSVPRTQFWQGIKISGNPLLGAYVTEIEVKLGTEDGSDENMNIVSVARDNDINGAQTATTILTYRIKLKEKDSLTPARHVRISPTKWVGPKPCLKFEAYFF